MGTRRTPRVPVVPSGELAVEEAPQAAGAWGYPAAYSLFPGETLRLHVSASQRDVRVRVYRLTDWADDGNWSSPPRLEVARASITETAVGPKNGKPRPGTEAWGWPQNVNVPIPASFPGGIYIAELAAFAGQSGQLAGAARWVMFVVKKRLQAAAAPILYKFNLNTIQAYNLGTHPDVAGNTPNGIAAFNNDLYQNPLPATGPRKVTLQRPVWQWAWINKSIIYDFPLVKWIERQGFQADYCTDVDLHLDTKLQMLSRYAMVVSAGHDEYWSRQMFDNLTTYRNRGGNISFLSGNTCCWVVHYGDVVSGLPTSFTVDKGALPCDVNGPDAFFKLPSRENALVGAATRSCAIRGEFSPPYDAPPPPSPVSPGYRVQNPDHWILAGTGLSGGDNIGNGNLTRTNGTPINENLIGYEGNGVRITLNPDGSGTPTYDDGTPPNFIVLGVGVTEPYASSCNPQPHHWGAFSREDTVGGVPTGVYAATMGFYSGYGLVFNAATVYWSFILNGWDAEAGKYRGIPQMFAGGPPDDGEGHPVLGNPHLHRITRNVFTALTSRRRNVAAVVDLDRNGRHDLVLQHELSGDPAYWLLNGTARTAAGSIVYKSDAPGSRLRIAGAGNLTAANSTDLVLQDRLDGHLEFWTVAKSGSQIVRDARGPIVPGWADPVWQVVAVVDVNRDGRADLLFQNQDTGALYYWVLENLEQGDSGDYVSDFADTNWRLAATVDLDGDGQDDIVFQNRTDGSLFYWTMDGVERTGFGELPTTVSSPNLQLAGGGDLFHDGTKTLLFQNQTNGAIGFIKVIDQSEAARGTLNNGKTASPWFMG